jgi:hypothetical protein
VAARAGESPAPAKERLAVGKHQAEANRPKITGRVVLVPERIKALHRPGLDVRHAEEIAEVVRAEQRTVGDETVDVNAIALQARQFLQVEIKLRLERAEPDRAGFDPAADIGEQIVGIGECERDATIIKGGA